MADFAYSGTELDVFQHAVHWKKYWSTVIAPFIGERVLDVGAGIGATAEVLAHRRFSRWVELEPDSDLAQRIRQARARGEIPAACEVVVGTSSTLDESDRFDTVLYIDVLEHIEDDRAELERVLRHLEPGGNIIIVAPAHNSLYTEFDRRIGHYRRYDRAMLKALLPPGCEIAALRHLDSVGLFASLANRLVLKSGTPTAAQVRLWDRVMVRLSRLLDPLLFGRLGKSIVCVYRKSA